MKNYKVFRVSENSNAFGLKQFYAMAKDGATFRACANSLNLPKIGSIITGSSRSGFELIEFLDCAPYDVVKEVYNN